MRYHGKMLILIVTIFICISNVAFADITQKQGEDVAEFAKTFIEKGNARRDENGFPLLTYALSGNWKTCVEIRDKGYNENLYYIKNNSYYYRNGRYMELGNKWCMDCGTFVTYVMKTTLGLDLYNSTAGEPWHVQDIYNDACKGNNSKYFYFVYKQTSIYNLDYSKLQKGDIIARVVANGNHGMVYLGDGMIAHANRDMIKYTSPAVSGFQVSKLLGYYLGTTKVNVIRVKDGIVDEDYVVNSKITWPDTGEVEYILGEPEDNSDYVEIEVIPRYYHNKTKIHTRIIEIVKSAEGSAV